MRTAPVHSAAKMAPADKVPKATKPVPAQPDAAGSGAFLSLLLLNELCGQDLRVAQVHAELLAVVHVSARERLEPLFHSCLHAETAHSALECLRSQLGVAQSFPEAPVDDPSH